MYDIYLNELNDMTDKISKCHDKKKLVSLIEDYKRLRTHLLSFSSNECINKNIPNINNVLYSKFYRNMLNSYRDDFINNASLIFDFNKRYSDLFNDIDVENEVDKFHVKDSKYYNGLSLESKNIDCKDLIKSIVNINDVTLNSFLSVNDRVTFSKNYAFSDCYGHCVSFINGNKPCVFIKKTGNSVMDYHTFSHELGHIVDTRLSFDHLVNKCNFFNESMSSLFENIYLDLIKKNGFNNYYNYLKSISNLNNCSISSCQDFVRLYHLLTNKIILDNNLDFHFNGDYLSDEYKMIFESVSDASCDIESYNYVLGHAISVTLLNSMDNYSSMINEVYNLGCKGCVKDLINSIDFNIVSDDIKKKIK